MIVEEFDYRLALVDVVPLLRERDHLVCLDSARVSEEIGRYSYVMASPSVVMVGETSAAAHGTAVRIQLRCGAMSNAGRAAQQGTFACDPLALCSLVLDSAGEMGGTEALPAFRGGWAGYVGYDYGAFLEGVTPEEKAQPGVPQVLLCWYDWVLAWDHLLQRAWIIVRSTQPNAASVLHAAAELEKGRTVPIQRGATSVERLLSEIKRELAAAARGVDPIAPLQNGRKGAGARMREPLRSASESPPVAGISSNFSRDEYLLAVAAVRELILAGDIFQANIAQRFSATHRGDAWQLYTRLRDESPASFAAFLEFPGCAVLSSSPEMFLTANTDGAVETRPIKGTRPRGSSSAEDLRLANELLASEKDRSENLMIVDLLRNDLSRVCEPGSVFVPTLFQLEGLATVQHLVSVVRGTLRNDRNVVDLFRACFPGGSITGAPKTRAMQIIAQIERVGRGVYCGSIGYFAADGGALFNIAIRTVTLAGGVATFPAGGGIVLDSDPASEYDETIAKAAGMARAMGESRLQVGAGA